MDDVVPKGRPISAQGAKYYLSPQAHCCEFDDGAIILDMRAATYLGIDAEHARILRACIENWPNFKSCDPDLNCANNPAFDVLVADLLARGILTTVPADARSWEFECPTTAWANPTWGAAHRIPIAHLLLFSTSSLRVLLRRKGRDLAALFGWIRRRQAAIQRNENSSGRQIDSELLQSFFRLRIWFYTAYRHCLVDSLILSVYLTRRMVPCTLVIGVSTRPFAAHAWVQIGDCVLNDTVEHVLTFTPILAVGDPK
jgi:hypothetical protein